VCGAAVTIPLKEQVGRLCAEVTDHAKAIGAINTLTRLEDGRIRGDNTDWLGIAGLLSRALRPPPAAGDVAIVIGAGGTARAAAYALRHLGFSDVDRPLMICNLRTPARAVALAKEFGGLSLERLHRDAVRTAFSQTKRIRAIVNTLPSSVDYSLDDSLYDSAPKPVLYEVTYLQPDTVLSRWGERDDHRCTVIRGVDMLIEQGIAQFALWTGRTSAAHVMRDAVMVHYNTTIRNQPPLQESLTSP
jgi:pentafunctional AROM polypeptide